jgi:hypothetical protein
MLVVEVVVDGLALLVAHLVALVVVVLAAQTVLVEMDQPILVAVAVEQVLQPAPLKQVVMVVLVL